MQLIILLVLSVMLLGCGADPFKASAIVDSSKINSLLQTASTGLPMRPNAGGGNAGGGSFRASLELDTAVDCDETTRRQFMLALRAATQNLLREENATIHGWGTQGPNEDLRGFSWEYTWGANNGILRIRYHPRGEGTGQLSIFCYEHTRGASAPPPAKGF